MKYKVLVTERYYISEVREGEAADEDEAREKAEAVTIDSLELAELEDVESYILEPDEYDSYGKPRVID